MDTTNILQKPCEIYVNDYKIGYTSGGVSLSLEHDVIENIPDQSSIVSSIITNNHVASVSIPYAEWNKEQISNICSYTNFLSDTLSFQNFYKFTESTNLKLVFDHYIFEFPYTIPILSFDRSYNKEDIRITNIDFNIITKDIYFVITKINPIVYIITVDDINYSVKSSIIKIGVNELPTLNKLDLYVQTDGALSSNASIKCGTEENPDTSGWPHNTIYIQLEE